MTEPATLHFADAPLVVAPDGSDVRVLLRLAGGSMAHFELAPGRVSRAIEHRTVSEIWYVLSGRGEMWRGAARSSRSWPWSPACASRSRPAPGSSSATLGEVPVGAVAVTMPPWPGDEEAIPVDGCAAWAAE